MTLYPFTRRGGTIGLAILASGLAVVLTAELSSPFHHDPAEATPAFPAQTSFASSVTETDLTAVILGRPLFSVDRRPTDDPIKADQSAQRSDIPRLTGILIAPDRREAIFQIAETGRSTTIDEGETIGRWRIVKITRDALIAEDSGETVKVKPAFDRNRTAAIQLTPPNPTAAQAMAVISNDPTSLERIYNDGLASRKPGPKALPLSASALQDIINN